jgi:hypothetical protein
MDEKNNEKEEISFSYTGDLIRQSDPIGIRRDFIKILSESGLWADIRPDFRIL